MGDARRRASPSARSASASSTCAAAAPGATSRAASSAARAAGHRAAAALGQRRPRPTPARGVQRRDAARARRDVRQRSAARRLRGAQHAPHLRLRRGVVDRETRRLRLGRRRRSGAACSIAVQARARRGRLAERHLRPSPARATPTRRPAPSRADARAQPRHARGARDALGLGRQRELHRAPEHLGVRARRRQRRVHEPAAPSRRLRSASPAPRAPVNARRMHGVARQRLAPRDRRAARGCPARRRIAPRSVDRRGSRAGPRPAPSARRERRVELAPARGAPARAARRGAGAGRRRDRRVEPPLGLARLPQAQLQRRERLDQLDVHRRPVVVRRVLERPRDRAHRRPRASHRAPLPTPSRAPSTRAARPGSAPAGRVADGAPEVQHRRQPVVRATPQRIVQRAALGAQHALERLPLELAQGPERADLPAETRPQLLERAHQRRARVDPVERAPRRARASRRRAGRTRAAGWCRARRPAARTRP